MLVTRGRFLLAVLVVGCAGAPPPPPPIVARLAPPAEGGAGARVDAALSRPPPIPIAHVELVSALEPTAPTLRTRNPSPPGAIQIDEIILAERLLVQDQVRIESEGIGRSLAPCFAHALGETAVTVVDFGMAPTARAVGSSASSACVAGKLPVMLGGTTYYHLAYRVTATSLAPSTPPAASDIQGEIAEIDRRLAATPSDDARARLTVLAGALHLELALASDRPAERERARLRFGSAPELDATQAAVRFGLGITDEAPDHAVVTYRALVCPNHYAPNAPLAIDQDHDERYWRAWVDVHPTPIVKGAAHPRFTAVAGGPERWYDETEYRSPYDGCVPAPGAEHAWLAEAWRAIGRFHEERDRGGGPFVLARAATAYARSLAEAPSPYVRLALGRVLYRWQRYHEAARVLRPLLDELEGASDPARTTLRERASQIFGSALTYFDFEGPAADEPAIDHADVIDTEPNPKRAEAKLAVVLERLADPALVPTAASYTPWVFEWGGWDLSQAGMYGIARQSFDVFLARWPLHRDAPVVAWERYDALSRIAGGFRPGTADAVKATKVATDAHAELARYVGKTPWTQANAGDAAALTRAEALAR